MIHLGDITKIQNAPFVDCITFGSPCQDLSIAGKRAGISGERSGLFMDAIRIMREMREASNGEYPRFAIWENVPGAFSSNGGEDFRTVLEELSRIGEAGVSIPEPIGGKWARAGLVCGNRWSIAWRTLDAQYWGVPQRRRRIALVVDFAGQCAGEILFKQESLPGDIESSGTQTEEAATIIDDIAGSAIKEAMPINDKATRRIAGNGLGIGRQSDPMFTLTSGDRHSVFCAASCRQNAEILEETSATLMASHEHPIIFPLSQITSKTCRTNPKKGDPCCTLTANEMNYCVVFDARGNGDGKIATTLSGGHESRVTDYTKIIISWQPLRRLTPTECERLQGFPDEWTDIGEWVDSRGKRRKSSDSARYEALGNSIALPQWQWIVRQMSRFLPYRATLGSLFDGIGGFPLVWERVHGAGTAIWASEIDEFCIAVTKKRFPK